MSKDKTTLYHFWQPRFWPVWLGVALLRAVCWLPQRGRMAVGRLLGRLIMRMTGKRRAVAEKNIEICLPELAAGDRSALVRRHFESIGMGVIELGIAWWAPDKCIDQIVELHGMEHVQAAMQQGKGILLLSGHFATTEVSGRAIKSLFAPMAAMYRPSKNPLIDQLMRRCRGRSIDELITKKGIRQLLKVLRDNRLVWYAADQAYNRKGSVLAPFFGEPAATNSAISQITRLSGTRVVPFFPMRLENGRGYRVEALPALENFPSGDDVADAERINKILEQFIRRAPEQYYWVHRRFKGRPEGYLDPYA
jgi:KDO2-lipid IV(A) lauroyltransferase